MWPLQRPNLFWPPYVISLYRGHMTLTWPKLNSNPQKPPAFGPLRAELQAPLVQETRLCSPPIYTFSVTSTGKLNNSRHLDWWKSWILVRMKAETVSVFISFMMVISKSCDIQDVLWSRSTSNWTTATTFSWVNSPSSDAKSYAPHEDNTCTYT